MRLYLIQHCEAKQKDIDPERPLSDKGRADLKKTCFFLKQADVQIDKIIHSNKLRSIQTAETIAKELSISQALETYQNINPKDSPADIIPKINQWDKDTLIVSHLPYLGKLVTHLLTGKDEPEMIAYQPGSVVCLEKNENGQWHINWIMRPELLKES